MPKLLAIFKSGRCVPPSLPPLASAFHRRWKVLCKPVLLLRRGARLSLILPAPLTSFSARFPTGRLLASRRSPPRCWNHSRLLIRPRRGTPVEPTPASSPDDHAESGPRGGVVEVTALEVPPAYQRAGHGSRLLAAAASTAIEQGASELQIWVLVGDDAHTSFLTAAGFAPAGLRRDLQVGEELVSQHCWHAFLNTEG